MDFGMTGMDGLDEMYGWNWIWVGRRDEGEETPGRPAEKENQNLEAAMRPEKKKYVKPKKARKPLINERKRDKNESPIKESQTQSHSAKDEKTEIESQRIKTEKPKLMSFHSNGAFCRCDLLTSSNNITIFTTGFSTVPSLSSSSHQLVPPSSSHEIVFDHLILNFP